MNEFIYFEDSWNIQPEGANAAHSPKDDTEASR